MNGLTFALASDVVVLVCACIGVVYGLIRFMKKKALFPKLVTWALGCFTLGKLSAVIALLTDENAMNGFHVAYLGYFGCFLFFISADYGYMDAVADDKAAAWRKYRLIALVAPAVMILFVATLLFAPVGMSKLLSGIICLLPGVPAVYFKLKHIIIPDVEDGIVMSIRRYNICALVLCFLVALGFVFEMYDMEIAETAANLLVAGMITALLPVLKKGVDRWIA